MVAPDDSKRADTAKSALTVLVVDDDADTRKAILAIIAPLGINPIDVSSGRQALTVLKKNDVACVISDLVMPRMSGMMLLHSMLEQGFHIPFIMTTGYSDKDSAIQALRLGAFDYLEKPLDPDDLRSVLREALSVSNEQRQLVQLLRAQGSHTASGGIAANAEIQVMKMRTLRFRAGTVDQPLSQGVVDDWETLKTLFVEEAEPQLTFCLAALDALQTGTKSETGFVLRVIQSIRMASEAVRVNDIAELAWALEKTLSAARASSEQVTSLHIDAMRQATQMLQRKVQALGSPEESNMRRTLDEVADSLVKKVPAA